MDLHPDFSDLLLAFNAENVRYLIVGAHALAAHGHARMTKDLDVWVDCTPDNAEQVFRALVRFGAPLDRVSVSDFADPDTIFQIGIAPVRIDILTGIDGVRFPDAWGARLQVTIGGIPTSVIGREALAQNKRTAGRPQDLIDLAYLENE
ncbi:MAG: hypothetical protein M3Y21_11310 [Candidatus Eremiobacteraeota bacterium]|nr:hypothetical protein [Candidatus Eremiobacteraeota bacterium]